MAFPPSLAVLAALAAQGLAPPADAEWRLAAADDDSATFVDHRSLLRAGNQVRFWSVSIYRKAGEKVNGIRTLAEADCRKFTYRPLAATMMIGGTGVLPGPGRTSKARKGSNGHQLIRAACGLDPPGAVSADPLQDMTAYWAQERR
ncbi:MAG TPA: surface-adhesin E family protein [Allosphingosinicella sp.]|nr:surface-adhesin E family protein [Allosphingosinicella sp.]